ncbi:MAG: MFS transporter [Rhodospirillales bacterium]|nr:MFS transporter [Rhodospirillales bacterium]
MATATEKRNVALLAMSQALFTTSQATLIILSGLVGHALSINKALATLPVSSVVLAAALTTIPASLYMHKVGRRRGFLTGAAFGIVGSLIAAYSIWISSFWLFVFGTFVIGINGGFAPFYRFAAADAASGAFKSKAISYVVSGGLVAAFIGPLMVRMTTDLFEPVMFLGTYVSLIGVALIAMAVLAFLQIPPLSEEEKATKGRPLLQIIRQPVFIVAVIGGMVGYGIMSLIMTAAPLAIVGCGYGVNEAATVIQWHIVAMFAPAFFTGSLISRYGVLNIMLVGMILLAGCVAVALSGLDVMNFTVALIALGLGWNFSFVGASTLVTEAYEPSERAKVQAINDFLVFGTVAVGSLGSGALLHFSGWDMVQYVALPFIILSSLATLGLAISRKRK